ncbi:MAG TPA: hypothetical protein VNU45_09190 [Rummeliibacillus sp.]|nr:hypothetical protein [Rummeliibacillus sp.]
MNILNYTLDTIGGEECIKATVAHDGKIYNVLEWINRNEDGEGRVERTDSHIKIHGDIGDLDRKDVYDLLDTLL